MKILQKFANVASETHLMVILLKNLSAVNLKICFMFLFIFQITIKFHVNNLVFKL